jgi:N-acetylmuramoyl-L-alanine amidase
MWQSIISIRKSRLFLVGSFLATALSIALSSTVSMAQITQPSLCANQLVAPPLTGNDPVVEVISEMGVARTGPHDDCRRVTPLPRGTRARVVATGMGPNRAKQLVPWSQLDYGAWIESSELRSASSPDVVADLTTVQTRILPEFAELVFPLSLPVPIEVQQGDRSLSLTLHNTQGKVQSLDESGTIQNWQVNSPRSFNNPVVMRGTWQNIGFESVRFNFQLKSQQQWGYRIRYEGNNFVLSLRQVPRLSSNPNRPLDGLRLVVDPGHGGSDSGAVGRFDGIAYMEKTLNMQFSEYLERELQNRGAIVTMTRTNDAALSLDDRQLIINRIAPTLAISIHHDSSASGRVGARGTSIYWFHPQSQPLASFLLDRFARLGNRPILNNNGVLQKPFAVTRPSIAPAVLLEVGFVSDRAEVTELAKPATQQRLAGVLAEAIERWIVTRTAA